MSRNAPQLPNNALTANAISVPTTTGFAAGDYIYNQNNNFAAIPDNAVSTGTFNIVGTNMANYGNGMSGGIASVWNPLGVSKYQKMSAVLTNGNVVTVSSSGVSSNPKFVIDTPSKVNVVAQTEVSTSFTCWYGNIGVLALSGGGFVVFWNNRSGGALNVPTYAVYSNTGSVVTAAQQDTSFTTMPTTYSHMNGVALPNGGFVLVCTSPANAAQYRIYGATGTGVYGTTTLTGSTASANEIIGIAARSDSSFCVSFRTSATTQNYTIISATNTAIVGSTSFSVTSPTSGTYHSSVTTLSNDTFVIGYVSGSSPMFRLLPTGNTLGSESTVSFSTNSISGSNSSAVTLLGLTAGNFVYSFIDNYEAIQYAFYSNTGTLLAATQLMPSSSFNGNGIYMGLSLIELSSTVNFYFPNGNVTGGNGLIQSYFQVNKTTYSQVNLGVGLTSTIASPSATVSGYARSVSTPSSASFYSASTQTLSVNNTPTQGVLTSAIVASSGSSVHCCPLINGTGFAVAVAGNASPYEVTIYIYNISGVLQRTIAANSSASNNSAGNIKIALMSSGNLVLSVGAGTSYLGIYSPTTGERLASRTVNSTNYTGSGAAYMQQLVGISGDRFVFNYYDNASSYNKSVVYSNACLTLATIADPASSSMTYGAIGACLNAPGFWVAGQSGGFGSQFATFYRNTSGNSFSQTDNIIVSGQTGMVGSQGVALSNNTFAYMALSGATTIINTPAAYAGYGSSIAINDGFGNSGMLRALSCNAFGAIVFASLNASGTGGYLGVSDAGGAFAIFNSISLPSAAAAASPNPCLAPLYDGTMAFAWIDSTNRVWFSLINTATVSYSTNLTAGVTTSNTALNPSPTNGYPFVGVSITSASAGTSGLVQNNGLAKLSSSYNASQTTVAFDTTNPVTLGVKGSVTGLNVIMQGN